jgi:hypothetical protein
LGADEVEEPADDGDFCTRINCDNLVGGFQLFIGVKVVVTLGSVDLFTVVLRDFDNTVRVQSLFSLNVLIKGDDVVFFQLCFSVSQLWVQRRKCWEPPQILK